MSITTEGLLPGDLIVTTDTASKFSRAVRSLTGAGPVSHIMLYSGAGTVIEAVPGEGVREVDFNSALVEASLAVALRHPGVVSSEVVQLARRRIGRRYDFLGAASEARVVLDGVPYRLITGSTDGYYCSSLLVEVFQEAGIMITTVNPDFKSPNDIAALSLTGDLKYLGHLK